MSHAVAPSTHLITPLCTPHSCTYGRKGLSGVGLTLFVTTIALYWPARNGGFLFWDDQLYVSNQPNVLKGLSWDGIAWASTTEVASNWHPLTMMSLQLDAQLFGPGPAGFHFSAILLHACNSVLTFLAVQAMTGCLWRSAAVAAIFALHPVRVESVAWISERKDLLSGLFFWLSILAYTWYSASPSKGRFALLVCCFTFGLCSKPMLVTLPCLLLLLDYWPLARWKNRRDEFDSSLSNLFKEKLPLFALSLIDSAFTLAYQQHAVSDFSDVSLFVRIKIATMGMVHYLSQTFWPFGLSPFYAYHEIPDANFYVALALLIAISGIAVGLGRLCPAVIVGWLWFVGMLVPVCGILQVGTQVRADRYLYLPQVGIMIAVVWSVAEAARCSRIGKAVAIGLLTIFLVVCGMQTSQQIPVWHDTTSIWRRAYQIDPDDYLTIQTNLIKSLYHEVSPQDAMREVNELTEITDGSDAPRMIVYAMLQAEMADYQSCLRTLDKSLAIDPENGELFGYRGCTHALVEQWQKAVDDFARAVILSPRSVEFHFNFAQALGKLNRQEDSQQAYRIALSQFPNWPELALKQCWEMATNVDPRQRLRFPLIGLAEPAIEAIGHASPHDLDILAAVYADGGWYDKAVMAAKEAIEKAEMSPSTKATAQALRDRLRLYEKHQPYRQYVTQPTPPR